MTEGPNKSVECAIMGSCGNGKTSLINNICGTNFKVGEALLSITRNIEQSPVLDYGSDFIIYDTPGINSTVETPLHATLLRAVLTYHPLNVIFVQARYGSRAIDFIMDLYKGMKMI
jgi:predicted GTPase